MQAAELTIVIPAYNRAELLPRTLASVAAQSLRPLCVVLVDNASTDSTLDVMCAWAAERHGISVQVLQESTPGAAAARNRGLAAVDTEWTMFFDSDDTMAPDHCARAVANFEGVDVVGWNVRYHKGGTSSVQRFYNRDYQYHSLFHGGMSTQRYMARTSLFREAGCWNPDVMYWNDIELGARILSKKPRIRHAGKRITVDMYLQSKSITGTDFSSRIEPAKVALREICRTLGDKGPLYTAIKAAILAADSAREGSEAGPRLFKELIRKKGACERMLLSAAYHYQKLGGRATARLLRPLI